MEVLTDLPRVVITGFDGITPGGFLKEALQGLERGLTYTDHFKLPGDDTIRIAGYYRDFNPTDFLGLKDVKRSTRCAQIGYAAIKGALESARIEIGKDKDVDAERISLFVGTAVGGSTSIANPDIDAFSIGRLNLAQTAGLASRLLGIQGITMTYAEACAAGLVALGEARDKIRLGKADVVIAGATDSCVDKVGFGCFGRMKVLSQRLDDPKTACRPWDRERDGFVLSEGAVFFVLESLAHAQARGATILVEITGFAQTSDAHHPFEPEDDGNGIYRAASLALLDAKLNPDQINLVVAHAPGTKIDEIEAGAYVRALGENGLRVPFHAPKGPFGHMQGTASAMAAAVGVDTILRGYIPPNPNTFTLTEEAQNFNVLRPYPLYQEVKHVAVGGEGLEGVNASCIISRFID